MQIKWSPIVLGMLLFTGCGGNREPVAQFELVGGGVAETGRVKVDASGCYDEDGEIVSYHWEFGDGETAFGTAVDHQYVESGQYTVILTVVDDQGAKVSVGKVVAVDITNIPPYATMDASDWYGTAPLEVDFSGFNSVDRDGAIAAYEWKINGQVRSTAGQFRHTFVDPGQYTIELTVEDQQGVASKVSKQVTLAALTDRFSIEGRINAAANIDVDGDLNDPRADYFNNDGNTTADIQPLSNPVLLNGFVTADATAVVGDAFTYRADLNDVYAVHLQQGDYVSLQIVNFALADLDLLLLDSSTYEVVLSSTSVDEFESVQAPREGDYLVMVSAISSQSKYLLSVGATSLASPSRSQGQTADFEPEQLIIKSRKGKYASSIGRAQLRMSHRDHGRAALAYIDSLNPQTQDELQLQNFTGDFARLVELRNPKSARKIRTLLAMKYLARDQNIEYVEPNYRVRPFFVPNDPAYPFQWSFPAMNLPKVWDITRGDSNVIVAVVDSGIYSAHPDLQGPLISGYDFISDPEMSGDGDGIDPDPEDTGESTLIGGASWHGTHVTGLIGASMNNRQGGVGVAPGVKIMPMRAIGLGGGNNYDVFQAVRFAAGLENDSGQVPSQPADIINLSIGGGGYSNAGQDVFSEVRNKGIFVLAASGNENTGVPMYPASYRSVVSVAGTDINGKRAPYSNFGPFVDLAAPGGDLRVDQNNDGYTDGILSTSVLDSNGIAEPKYLFLQGTSMATPQVSGIVALMKSVYPQFTPSEFDSLIASGVITQDQGELGRDDFYGHGIIDAFLAVNAAQNLANGGETAALETDTYALTLDHFTDTVTIEIRSLGNGLISVAEIKGIESWLTLLSVAVDDNGIGTYRVALDRQGLANGSYRSDLEFVASTGQRVIVQIIMRVGEATDSGDAGFLNAFLYRADNAQLVASLELKSIAGEYFYKFDNIPPGNYQIVAGSDIDNDGDTCVVGESCGIYPTIDEYGIIPVYQNRQNLNFAVGLYPSLKDLPVTAP